MFNGAVCRIVVKAGTATTIQTLCIPYQRYQRYALLALSTSSLLILSTDISHVRCCFLTNLAVRFVHVHADSLITPYVVACLTVERRSLEEAHVDRARRRLCGFFGFLSTLMRRLAVWIAWDLVVRFLAPPQIAGPSFTSVLTLSLHMAYRTHRRSQPEERPRIRFSNSNKTKKSAFFLQINGALGRKLWRENFWSRNPGDF